MKTSRKLAAVKRSRAGQAVKRPLIDKKARARGNFAPELCGVMGGPSDLSRREGFAHG